MNYSPVTLMKEIKKLANRKILDSYKVILIVFLSHILLSQSNIGINWTQIPSPEYSDIKQLYMFSSNSGIAAGNRIMIYRDSLWQKDNSLSSLQNVKRLIALDTNSIFATIDTKYQESELHYWNGDFWIQLTHPLANTIESMFFIDQKNGIISGIGEVAVLKDSKWSFLPPPTHYIIRSLLIQSDSCFYALCDEDGVFKYTDKWEEIRGSKKVKLMQIYDDNVYVIGDDFVGVVAGDSVTIISKYDKLNDIVSFSVINPENIVAVGRKGLILQYSNGKWMQIHSNTSDNILKISMLNENEGMIVGDDGLILQLTNNSTKKIERIWKGFENLTYFGRNSKVIDDEYGVVIADFNCDGLADIFTCGLYEEDHLYINIRNNVFFDEARIRRVNGSLSKTNREYNLGACAVDWDNDGDVDLYVSVLNSKNKLFENRGGKYFTEYSSIVNGVGDFNDRTNACCFGDIDNDGDLDLFITNEYSSNRLYLNNGVGVFKDITDESGLMTKHGGMACSFGDIDNDGDIDLYVANWSSANILYKNLLEETGKPFFKDITANSNTGGEIYTKSNAVVFADIDNDADLDLYVTNRKASNRLYINNGKGSFTDKTKEILGTDTMKSNGVIIADFDGNGWKDIFITNVGVNAYFENKSGVFYKKDIGLNGYSTGAAYADFDNDGDLDIYVANYVGESSMILKNKLNNNQYIKIKIEGIEINRSGVGTKIYTYKDKGLDDLTELIDFRQITAGSGYASMNELTQTIQIQNNDFVDVKIVFPNGSIKILNHLKVGSTRIISDVNGIKKQFVLIKKFLLRRLLDPHELYELIKWFFVLAFVFYTTKRGYLRYKWKLSFAIFIIILAISIYFVQYYYLEYDNFMFATLLPFISIIGLVLILHLFYERRRTAKLAIAEQEQIRAKLSRDLHDDLASTISSIGIYLTLIRYKITGKEKKLLALLDKSESLVGDAASSITDLIWAINPKRESLSNLIARINNNFAELFTEKGIDYKVVSNLSDENIILQPKIKQNIYLIIKEVMNNSLKYSNSETVTLNMEKTDKIIKITIEDNGIGFDPDKAKGKGHGLGNMQRRAEDTGGEFEIISMPGQGTKCILRMKI